MATLAILLVVPAAVIDLERRIIPNRLTAAAAVLALTVGTLLDPAGEPERLIAGAAAGGLVVLVALAGRMGMGDVKLAAVLGLLLGRAVAPAILVALLSATLAALLSGRGREGVPFAPFLALGAVVAVMV
jgi:leader peptidase (prepilin peptidase)/N-methyltransferase